jgi:hypothetical protein
MFNLGSNNKTPLTSLKVAQMPPDCHSPGALALVNPRQLSSGVPFHYHDLLIARAMPAAMQCDCTAFGDRRRAFPKEERRNAAD